MENKVDILKSLGRTLNLTRACDDIIDISYEKNNNGEYAIISYNSGLGMSERRIDITADSGIAMIYDIVKALM